MQHPLFPDAEDDGRELGFLRVHRFSADGKRHVAPESFSPDDMADIEQLFGRFGGGNYELVAHDPHGRVITRTRLAFEGRPRPLAGEPDEPEHQPAASGNGHSANPLMLAMLQLMQQQAAQQTQLLVALVERGDKTSREHIATMQALHDRHAQSQSELMAAILNAGRSGGDPSNSFQQGVQFATGFAERLAQARAETGGSGDDDDGDDVMGMLGTLAEAAQTMMGAKQQAQQFAASRTEPAPEPPQQPRSKHPPKSPAPPPRASAEQS